VKYLVLIIPSALFIASVIAIGIMLPQRIYAIEEARMADNWTRTISLINSNPSSLSNIADPYKELIKTATGMIIVYTQSDEDIETHNFVQGGLLAFVKGQQPLLTIYASDSYIHQTEHGTVEYKGNFGMDINDPITLHDVLFLKQAEYVQIQFAAMPKVSHITGGKAVVLINGTIPVEIPVFEQSITDGRILSSPLDQCFANFK